MSFEEVCGSQIVGEIIDKNECDLPHFGVVDLEMKNEIQVIRMELDELRVFQVELLLVQVKQLLQRLSRSLVVEVS